MLKHPLFSLLALCAVLLATACGKDDEPTFTEADLTVSDGWSILEVESNLDVIAPSIAASIPEEDLGFFTRDMIAALFVAADGELETIEVCESDDIYIFLDGGNISFTNSGTLCDNSSTDPESDAVVPSNTTWRLDGNQLTLTANGEANTFTVLELNDMRLTIELREQFDDPTTGFSTDDTLVLKYTFRAN